MILRNASMGEGVVVEDSGEKIFRRTHTLKNGKRYIISSWDKESWELNDVITLRAPDEGLSIETHAATSYMYVDGVPFFTQDAVATNSANIWRFETSGNEAEDEGYLVCEHTGYGRTWCLGMGWDLTTLGTTIGRVPDGPMGYTDSAASLFSAEWRWGAGLVSVRTSGSEHYWVGYERASGSWKIISGSDWDGDAHLNAYLFEETNNVATAILSDKVGYVGVNGTTLPTKIIKTWSTGLVEYVPLELSMLSTSDGSPVDTSTAGNYSNLSVTYNGVVICTDYTLAVGTEVTGAENSGKYYYRLVKNLEAGKQYLFVSRNTEGKAYAMASTGYNANTGTEEITVQMDANGLPCIRSNVTVPAAAVWNYVFDDSDYQCHWVEQPTTVWNTPGLNYLSFNNETPPESKGYEYFNESGSYLYTGAHGANWPVRDLKSYDSVSMKGWSSYYGWHKDKDIGDVYAYLTFDKHDAAFVSVGDAYRKWGEEVYIYEKTPITSVTYEALGTSGKVNVGDGATTRVGTSVEIRYPDGSVVVEKVTADMLYLNGNALTDGDLASPIRMPGLTLKYNGQTLTTNFTLDVMSETENDYPQFPAPGAVRVNKQLGKPDFIFNQTGVAKVDLAVTGTPKQTPMDVLVILDTSSSVVDNYVETGETRLEVMRQALGDMIDTLQAPNPDGSIPDICLAVSQFNDYANQGPNNETYLAGGQAVAFNLITNTNPASIQSIQIGAKLAKGSQAKLYYNTKELVTLTTATNMFYKLKGLTWTQIEGTNMWKSSTIVLSNASTGTDNIISLTDVKITSGKAIQLVTESASAVSDPVAMLEEVQGPAIVLCADGLTVERTDAVMKAIEESTKAEAENPEQKPEDDNQDTSSPSTGDPAELLLPALTILAMLCFFEIMVLIKLDNKAKMEVRR